MENEIENIKKYVAYNAPAKAAEVTRCNVKLQQAGLPCIPKEYAAILFEANGWGIDDINVFGAEIEDESSCFADIYTANLFMASSDKANILVLGEDEDSKFVFNATKSLYQIIDKVFDDVHYETTKPIDALTYFLRILGDEL